MDFITIPLGWLSTPNLIKTAISLPELVSQTNAFSVKRRSGCVPTLTGSDPKELFLSYQVQCHESYSDPAGHDVKVKFDVSKVEETQMAKDLDVQVKCTCPAFLYWGAQWNLHQRDGLLGDPRPELIAPTERLDLRGNFVICKHCLAPDSKVLMADGTEKDIENIVVGDWVITHKGRARQVIATSSRPAKPEEQAVQYKAKGAFEPLTTSADHLLAAVRGNETCFCGCKGNLPYDYRGVNWGRKYLQGHSGHGHAPSKLTLSEIDEIKSSQDTEKLLAEKFNVSQATISRVKNKSVRPDDPEVEDCSTGKIHWLDSSDLSSGEYLYFPRMKWEGTEPADPDLAALLGYYLAEGNPIYRPAGAKFRRSDAKSLLYSIDGVECRVYGVVFTLNTNEVDTLAADIVTRARRLLGEDTNISIKERSYSGKRWLNVIVNHSKFAVDMLRLAGYGSTSKKLSAEAWSWDLPSIQQTLSSYVLGDGHLDEGGQQYVFSTSRELISQISTILFSLGVWNGYLHQIWQGKRGTRKKKNPYHRLYWDYRRYPQVLELMRNRLRPHVQDKVDEVRVHSQESDYWGEGFLRVLSSIKHVTAPSQFHDISVDEDESFIANRIVVHNCKAVFERILPSVQHNIVKILRERTIEKNKDNYSTPMKDKLNDKQQLMKERKEREKSRKTKNKEIQDKLMEALRQREEERLNNQELSETEIGRDELATNKSVPTVETPHTEDIGMETGDISDLLEQEETKLHQQEQENHDKIKNKPHLHKGLPYEVEEEKEEHGHGIPTDRELLKTLKKQQPNPMKDFLEKRFKRKQTSLELSLLADLAAGESNESGD
jgi:hypothetical protein